MALFVYNVYMTLKAKRKQVGYTQIEASKICGVSLRTYKRLENDHKYVGSIKYEYCLRLISDAITTPIITKSQKEVLIIGCGYVGYATAISIEPLCHVSILDIDEEKLDLINSHISPLSREKIDVSFDAYKELPNIEFDVYIIALPTDYEEETKTYKDSLVREYVKRIRKISSSALIIIKSTVSLGFNRCLSDQNIIFVPEFLTEAHAIEEAKHPQRIVVGTFDGKPNALFKYIYRNLWRAPLLWMTYEEAETVKLFSNTYLALRVSFFNELDSLLASHNLDAQKVIKGISLDKRIGDYYNNPSFGYGGYCLPKDTLVASHLPNDNHELISSISISNEARKDKIASLIARKASILSSKAIIGVYISPYSRSRKLPVLDIATRLENKGYKVIYSKDMGIERFKKESDIILLDRYVSLFDDVKEKVFSRDLNQ